MTTSIGQHANVVEQRVNIRYRVVVPVICRWRDQYGIRRIAEGTTRDISTRGAFVSCGMPPAPGAAVRLDMLFGFKECGEKGLRLHADGQVLRVDSGCESTGFAMLTDFTGLNRWNWHR